MGILGHGRYSILAADPGNVMACRVVETGRTNGLVISPVGVEDRLLIRLVLPGHVRGQIGDVVAAIDAKLWLGPVLGGIALHRRLGAEGGEVVVRARP